MAGSANWKINLDSNIKSMLSDAMNLKKEIQGITKQDYKIDLNIDERKIENLISSLNKMINNLGSGKGNFEQFDSLSREIKNTKNEIESLKGSISQLISDNISVGNFADKLDDNLRSVQNTVDNLSKGFVELQKILDNVSNKNNISSTSIVDENSLKTIIDLFSKMESHLGNMKKVFSDVGDGEEFSPLLKMINNVQSAISELSTSVKSIGLNMNIDVGSDSELEAKAQSKISNALQAYQRLFEHIKTSSAGGQIITDKFFNFDINQYDTMMGKLQAYKKFIDNMRKEAKTQFNGQDVLYQDTDKSYWTQASSAMGQVTKAFNEMKSSANDNPLTNMFGKTDLSEVVSQLDRIVAKLEEISTTASSFKNVFDNGFNVTDSIEEIDKLTNRVKELEEELSKVKLNTVGVDKSNILSENSSTAEAEKYQQITNDTVSVLTDVGKTEDQIIAKIQKERQEAEANNDVLREHLVLLDSAGKVIANHWGSKSNVNGTFTSEQLAQANGGKIIHAHPGKASFFGGKDLQNLIQNSMYDQIKQVELIWGDSTLSVDKSTLTKESSSALLNIMRNVRSKLTEIYSDNQGGTPSQEAREHINAIEKEIFKAVSQKLDISVSEKGTMSQEVVDSLSDIDKAIIKKFRDIESSVVRDINPSDIISSVLPMKDVFQGDNKAITDASATAIKEESKALEQVSDSAKEASESKEKFAKANKEVKASADSSKTSISEEEKYFNSLGNAIEKYNNTLTAISRKPADGNRSKDLQDRIDTISSSLDELRTLENNANKDGYVFNKEDVERGKQLEQTIKDNIEAVKQMSAAQKGSTPLSRGKTIEWANDLLKENTKWSKKARIEVQGWIDKLATADPSNVEEIRTRILEIVRAEREAGREGRTWLDIFKDKKIYSFLGQAASMFSFYDLVNLGREGFETIKEYDNALTEMNKVSKESIEVLKDFQKESFDLSDAIGTTASQIQNSTADFLRLGESFEQAKQSAQDANALFKVAEFDDIGEATEALVAMSQAYKDLEKSQINDVLNYTGNNFSISTSELASALQRSAATLKVAGNDIYEATALVTAGNAVLQDAETVGSGLKMISLRLLGTEEAKNELASLGEDVDDFVVQTQSKIDETVRSYTAVASNAFKGISVLDENGNYRSTYEILRDISLVYQEILDADKKAGTNRGQALLEVLAGKNRSNVAASILQSPELLTSVYEETMKNAQGSVEKELESQLQSIETHLNQLKNAWDKLWVNENNREIINFFLDLAKGILEVVDNVGVLNTAFIGIGAGLGIKNLGKTYKCTVFKLNCFGYALYA